MLLQGKSKILLVDSKVGRKLQNFVLQVCTTNYKQKNYTPKNDMQFLLNFFSCWSLLTFLILSCTNLTLLMFCCSSLDDDGTASSSGVSDNEGPKVVNIQLYSIAIF